MSPEFDEEAEMRKEEIEELIRLVEDSQINELEISEGRRKIRISKGSTGQATVLPANAQGPLSDSHSDSSAQLVENKQEDPSASEAGLASNLKQIISPMVGTFYSAPSPDAEPFVAEGQAVAVGQTVCIVEAMKLMNEIGSDFNGVIRKVLIDNAQPVEYGQPLFLVETK
jgi:acetyl-CoA carboxylase biotin carboxyl carrier protein